MKTSKLLVLAVLFCVALASYASAENTSGTDWETAWLNQPVLRHGHGYTDNDTICEGYEPKAQLGLGVDVTVFEFSDGLSVGGLLESVEVQNKFDLNNNVYSGYIVVQTNLWEMLFAKK